MKSKRLAKSKNLSLDIISTLPENIIETILCRLSTQEAVRTSILSRDWRYKWTKIPKLEFSKYTFEVSTDDNQLSDLEQTSDIATANECKMMRERCKVFRAIYQVLSLHQGPITDFTLDLDMDKTCFEINDVIRYLSRNNAVKKLKLELSEEVFGLYYWIPLSIFPLQHLTDLHLYGCVLNMKSPLIGFRSLTSLYLENVYIYTKTLLHLVSNCPLLKTFTLLLQGETSIFDQPDDKNTVIELVECFPKIENLTTWSWITECFVLDAVPQELPVLLLIHLKYISFTCMSANGLYFLAFLMRCSPNVEKIEIEIDGEHFSDEMISIILKAYSNIWLEHLNELNIVGFSNVKPDLEFVKFILAKSPKLKKVYLLLYNVLEENEESEMLKILSHYAPESQEVQDTVQHVAGGCTSVYTIKSSED